MEEHQQLYGNSKFGSIKELAIYPKKDKKRKRKKKSGTSKHPVKANSKDPHKIICASVETDGHQSKKCREAVVLREKRCSATLVKRCSTVKKVQHSRKGAAPPR